MGNCCSVSTARARSFKVSSPDVTCDLSFSGSATSLAVGPLCATGSARERPGEARWPRHDHGRHPAGFGAQRHHLEHQGNYGRTDHRAQPRGKHGTTRCGATDHQRPKPRRCFRKNSPTQPFSTTSRVRLRHPARRFSTRRWAVAPGQDQEWHWAIVQAKGIRGAESAGSRQRSLRSLITSICNLSHVFSFATLQTAIGRIQNFLVLPAFFAGHWKRCFSLDRIGESVDLSGISHAVRNLDRSQPRNRRDAIPA